MMIKLIVSDIDGTLIPYGEAAYSPRLMPLVRALMDKGILFSLASGRQFSSIRRHMGPLTAGMPILAENGALVFGPGEREEDCPLLAKTPLPRSDALAIARELQTFDQGRIYLACRKTGYAFQRDFIEAYAGGSSRLIGNLEEIQEDIFKVSLQAPGQEKAVLDKMVPRWGKKYAIATAGDGWVDFTLADKGKGLAALCGAYDIDLRDVVAFGDNFNDLPMLALAGRSYVVDAAPAALKARIPNHCRDVCDVLEEILRSV